MNCDGCARVGEIVVCTTCGLNKVPVGRSAPLEHHGCHHDCPGYRQDPYPDSLWPGERWGDSLPCIHKETG